MTTIKNQIKLINLLVAARALIDSREKWIQNSYARDKDGKWASIGAKDAVCFCSDGALLHAGATRAFCQDDLYCEASDALRVQTSAAGSCGVINYNDNHTYEQVIALWDRTIQQEKDKLVVMNLELLIETVKAQPKSQFDLGTYKKELHGEVCGTFYCTGGLATTVPEFKDQGFELKPFVKLEHESRYGLTVAGEDIWTDAGSEASDEVFGDRSMENLFEPRWDGGRDISHPQAGARRSDLSDQELAIWRLEQQLAFYKEKVDAKAD